jgi:hypothetical protein
LQVANHTAKLRKKVKIEGKFSENCERIVTSFVIFVVRNQNEEK